MSEIFGLVMLGAGLLVLAVAGLGLLRLPDALSRQHAATKAGTLGLVLILPGVALAAGHPDWFHRLAALALILLVTLPVAGHALARLAREEGVGPVFEPVEESEQEMSRQDLEKAD